MLGDNIQTLVGNLLTLGDNTRTLTVNTRTFGGNIQVLVVSIQTLFSKMLLLTVNSWIFSCFYVYQQNFVGFVPLFERAFVLKNQTYKPIKFKNLEQPLNFCILKSLI